jgi:site-specific DNA recombinase
MQKAVVYLRVSTKEQATTQSLGAQLEGCTGYCRQHDLELVRVFRDAGESAKTAQRPEFRELLDFCKKNRGQVDYLIVQDLSRFSRNTHDHEVIRALLLASGVRLRSCREPIDESAAGKLTERMIAAVAQFENDLKSERTVERMKAAAAKGRYMWKAPVGYVNAADPSLVPDGGKAPLVRQAF